MTKYTFDYERIAILMTLFMPLGRVTLVWTGPIGAPKRWDFGKCQVNVLMMMARCGEVAIPLFWELLDNKTGPPVWPQLRFD